MKAMATIAAAAFAVVAQAIGDNLATRRADTPDKRLARECELSEFVNCYFEERELTRMET